MSQTQGGKGLKCTLGVWRDTVTPHKGLEPVGTTSAMAGQPCDGCGESVSIAGGIANIWTQESRPTEGIVLELSDGTEHFLCYACIDALPDDHEVTADDVAALDGRG